MMRYYTRSIDAGCGRQNVIVKDGVIVQQYLVACSGSYTGAGNPALLGQPESRLSKLGFRRVPGPQVFNLHRNCWISIEVDEVNDESELD